jgi:hypothetical protein
MLVLFAGIPSIGNAININGNTYYIALACMLMVGMTSSSYICTSGTLFQMLVNDEFRGRVTSIYMVTIGTYPLAIMVVGAIADAMGASVALYIFGGILTAFMLSMAVFSRRIRQLE